MLDPLSLGFFFDIDAKLILIHREGINILILAYKHVYTSTMSKALFWLLALLSEDFIFVDKHSNFKLGDNCTICTNRENK